MKIRNIVKAAVLGCMAVVIAPGISVLALTILAGAATPPPVLAQPRGAQSTTHVRVFEGVG